MSSDLPTGQATDWELPVMGVTLIALIAAPAVAGAWLSNSGLATPGLGEPAPLAPAAAWPAALADALAGPIAGIVHQPVLLLGLLGLAARGAAPLAAAALVLLAAVLCPPAASFGHRALLPAAPLLALGLAELHARVARRGFALSSAAVLAVLVSANAAWMLVAAGAPPEARTRAAADRAAAPASSALPLSPSAGPLAALRRFANAPFDTLTRARASGDGVVAPVAVLSVFRRAFWWLIAAGALAALALVRIAFARPGLPALHVACGFVATAGVVLLVAAGQRARPPRTLTWSGAPGFVDAGHVVHRWRPARGTLGTDVDVVTYLDPVMGLRPGDDIAHLVVRDVHGRELGLPFFAGLDTGGETGADDTVAPAQDPLTGARSPAAVSLLGTRTARYTVSAQNMPRPIVAHAYRRTLSLPATFEIAEIRLERRHASCRMNVTGVWVSLAPTPATP